MAGKAWSGDGNWGGWFPGSTDAVTFNHPKPGVYDLLWRYRTDPIGDIIADEPVIVRGDESPLVDAWFRRLWHESQAAAWALIVWGVVEITRVL